MKFNWIQLVGILILGVAVGISAERFTRGRTLTAKYEELAADANVVKAQVKGLTDTVTAYESMLDSVRDIRTKAIISYIDGLFEEFAADDLILTREWWEKTKVEMLPEETEADE